jgi:hypothetical protein
MADYGDLDFAEKNRNILLDVLKKKYKGLAKLYEGFVVYFDWYANDDEDDGLIYVKIKASCDNSSLYDYDDNVYEEPNYYTQFGMIKFKKTKNNIIIPDSVVFEIDPYIKKLFE